MTRFMLAAAFAVFATAAAGAPAEPPAGTDPAKAEKKICRTERATGSLTRRTRICMTATEWRELNNRTRKGHDEMVGAASGGCRAPGDPRAGAMCGG
jgi:hypothetical protein